MDSRGGKRRWVQVDDLPVRVPWRLIGDGLRLAVVVVRVRGLFDAVGNRQLGAKSGVLDERGDSRRHL